MAEERMRYDTCPTCGGPVVVQGDGLTQRLDREADNIKHRFSHRGVLIGPEKRLYDVLREAASTLTTYEQALEAARAELVEKWLTRADKIDAENRPTDSTGTRLVAITTAGTLRDCAKALSARVDAALEGSNQ